MKEKKNRRYDEQKTKPNKMSAYCVPRQCVFE